jgi:hypothetical protein
MSWRLTLVVGAVTTLLVAGCSAAGHGRLMTWSEYRQLSHVVPYVLDLPCGPGRLVYIGSHPRPRRARSASPCRVALVPS